MNNLILKSLNQKIYFEVKKIALIYVFSFTTLVAHPQTMNYLGDGTYEFDTDFPTSHLHFYLFHDGFHSFSKNTVHKFLDSSIPTTPELYHKGPYQAGEPELITFPGVNEGTNYVDNISFQLANQVEIKTSWNLLEQKQSIYLLMFENTVGNEFLSGCVEFHFNKSDINISDDEILDDYGNNWVSNRLLMNSEYDEYTHKYRWDFIDLEFGEQRYVYIPAICQKNVLDIVKTRGVIKFDDCEIIIEENSKTDGSNSDIYNSNLYTLESVVSSYPHDPNCIVTSPDCLYYDHGNQTVQYKIYFQNDGEDPVQNVYIDIESLGEVNYSSITLTNSSHYCEMIWYSDGLHIIFPDILLPGIKQYPQPSSIDETIGWVELDFCFELENNIYNQGECISTIGRVTFDEQLPLPISNNLCYSTDCIQYDDVSVANCPNPEQNQNSDQFNLKHISSDSDINFMLKNVELIPNYSSDIINVIGMPNNVQAHATLVDMSAKEVKQLNISIERSIDISNLHDGVYLLKMNVNGQILTRKFVKF